MWISVHEMRRKQSETPFSNCPSDNKYKKCFYVILLQIHYILRVHWEELYKGTPLQRLHRPHTVSRYN